MSCVSNLNYTITYTKSLLYILLHNASRKSLYLKFIYTFISIGNKIYWLLFVQKLFPLILKTFTAYSLCYVIVTNF